MGVNHDAVMWDLIAGFFYVIHPIAYGVAGLLWIMMIEEWRGKNMYWLYWCLAAVIGLMMLLNLRRVI